MVIHLNPELETAVRELADREKIAPESLVLDILRERLLIADAPPVPRDEWERRLLQAATDCGVSLPHSALSRESMYD